jgi:hypothetical protein
MKFAAAAILLSLATLAVASDEDSSHHTNLRTTTTNDPFQQSACNDIKDEKQCFATSDEATGKSCVWCDCQAVPSVCVTVRSVQYSRMTVLLSCGECIWLRGLLGIKCPFSPFHNSHPRLHHDSPIKPRVSLPVSLTARVPTILISTWKMVEPTI